MCFDCSSLPVKKVWECSSTCIWICCVLKKLPDFLSCCAPLVSISFSWNISQDGKCWRYHTTYMHGDTIPQCWYLCWRYHRAWHATVQLNISLSWTERTALNPVCLKKSYYIVLFPKHIDALVLELSQEEVSVISSADRVCGIAQGSVVCSASKRIGCRPWRR